MIAIILIIAEKPSLARNIVAGIGKMKKSVGFYINNEYIVTWAFGHLFSLADIEDYLPNTDGRWSMCNIPCFPDRFMFKLKTDKATKEVDAGVKQQFETIKMLCHRDDVTTIVNAGDSDREGEIIIRICVEKADVPQKSFKRLWLPDQTQQTIRKALAEMKDETEYDNLAKEGFARTYIDWLYGVNLTRYATLKTGRLLRVGRVIVPIVKAIYDRDMQIRDFIPEIYYAITGKASAEGQEFELSSKEKFKKNELEKAKDLCKKYNASNAVVTSKKCKKDTLNPGKLYSLTKLQNVLGKKYKMSMEQSLKIVQDLYEKGYVTYPRTNSEYLATAEQDRVKTIIESIKKLGYPVKFKFKKTIFDNSKIESHSALTPTFKIPSKNALSEDEYKVYSAIMRRFAAVFCSEECVAERSEITIKLGNLEEFTLKGMTIIEKGWTKYDNYSKKDKILPLLNKGDVVSVTFEPCEKNTSPPRHYTIETLNNYLKNPFKEEKQNAETDDDMEEYRAIFEGLELGTEATRTGIIDNAKKSGYIQLKKDVYSILPDGEFLIESLERMHIIMDKYKTSELGKALKKVYRGEMEISDSVNLAKKEISSVFEKREEKLATDTDDGFVGDVAGICPVCGKNVVRNRYGYGCEGYMEGCKFFVGNIICGRVISISNMRQLLKTGKTYKIEGFVSKRTGKKFDAQLRLDNGRAVFDF
ncbi:MAG: DNA topoisomerase [Firmicutes bacterium]|nr:DNA topoisomerase [Bacillota bacterium]